MSVAEFQKYLGIGRNKAYQLCNKGGVPVIKVGTRILIDKEELDKNWIPKQKKKESKNYERSKN